MIGEKIQNIHQWDAGLFNSYSGKLINIHEPSPESITLYDIAVGLNNVCRFGGQIHTHHGVDKHTLLVHHLAPPHLKKCALLHDASEAFLGDVIKPLKEILGDAYKTIEQRFELLIFDKYGVDISLLAEIKAYDMQALELENNYFRHYDLALINQFKNTPYCLAVYDRRKSLEAYTMLLMQAFGG